MMGKFDASRYVSIQAPARGDIDIEIITQASVEFLSSPPHEGTFEFPSEAGPVNVSIQSPARGDI